MLCLCSLLEDSSNVVIRVFAHNGGQYCRYASQQRSLVLIAWLTRLNIVDALLTLIFRIAQWACRFLFRLCRQPILCVWISATNRHSDHQKYKIKNRWHSVNTHFQDGAGRVPLFFDYKGG